MRTALRLVSLDSALVSIGTPDPVPTPLTTPNPAGGVHFALVGNTWNTNYPFWYPFAKEDSNSQFRFLLEFSPHLPAHDTSANDKHQH